MTASKPLWRKPVFVLILGTVIIAVSYGSRQSYGMFLYPITAEMGWGRETLSFAIAFQNLIYGLSAPLVGAIADKWGPIKVLATAGIIYTVGLLLMSQASTPEGFVISIGLFAGAGASGCALPLILSLVGRVASEKQRSLWFGIVTSGGTAGQFLVVPGTQGMIASWGWSAAAMVLAAWVALVIPLAFMMSRAAADALQKNHRQSLGEVMVLARRNRGFWLLVTGFFVCGFQVQFINSHLPSYLTDNHLNAMIGAIAISTIGLFNLFGTWGAGWLGGRYRNKHLLAGLYLARSVIIMGFVILPLSETSVVVFAALVGLLWLATVPLTSGIVVQMFGARYLATLYGFVFMSHQFGSFTSVWLGGWLYDRTGSYNVVWWAIIASGLVAALLHWPIDDRRAEGLVEQEA